MLKRCGGYSHTGLASFADVRRFQFLAEAGGRNAFLLKWFILSELLMLPCVYGFQNAEPRLGSLREWLTYVTTNIDRKAQLRTELNLGS